jgi:diguanylate cyclase (GGDEF)-like protein
VSGEAGEAARVGRLGSAWPVGFASLPTRIVVSVFSAALITGIAVTAISIGSTESFLRAQIDERFPDLLRSTAHDLDQWYAQRSVDIATFAGSGTLAEGLRKGMRERNDTEARRYLAYVQTGFPQYRRLFVLDRDGNVRVSIGEEMALPPAVIEKLAAIDQAHVSGVVGTQHHRLQIVSAPIGSGPERLGTLHAVIEVDSVEALLGARDLENHAGLYVVGAGSTILAHSPNAPERAAFERPLPDPGAASLVTDYTTAENAHVVGSALRFERFDWTLVLEEDYDVAFAPVVGAMGTVLSINLGIVLLFGALAFVMSRSIVRPIRALSDTASRIASGETDVEIPRAPGRRDEIGVLSRALHEMVDRLRRNQVELQRKQEQIERANAELTRANDDLHRSNEILEQLSFTDGLTHLHNHRYFQDRLRLETKRADRSGEPLGLLLVDIDNFKWLNDRYGHAIGDEVLSRVATILTHAVRETDLVARYGGEEFAVLAPRTDVKGAVTLGERMRQDIAEARFRGLEGEGSGRLAVTVSVGVALYHGDPKRFFTEADRALYQAKREGKDCVVMFKNE